MTIRNRLQTVKKTRLYEGIVSQITSLILEGDLQVGDRLPSERELCERFGVGRNSVRLRSRRTRPSRRRAQSRPRNRAVSSPGTPSRQGPRVSL